MADSLKFVPVKHVSMLLNLLISENDLNQFIDNTKDISLLKVALQVKLHGVTELNQQEITFSINEILDQTDSDNTDTFDILKLSLMVQNNNVQFMLLQDYAFACYSETNQKTCMKFLKLLAVLLQVCLAKNMQNSFVSYLEGKEFDCILLNLLKREINIVNYLLVYVLPEYLKILEGTSYDILYRICTEAMHAKSTYILCNIVDFLISQDNNPLSSALRNEFLQLLQECICGNDVLKQREALYLLKRSADSFLSSTTSYMYYISRDTLETAWKNFFILLDISREKTLHLIMPAFKLLPTLSVLHPMWLICIYKILLSHHSTAVVYTTVLDLLKADWYKQDNDLFKQVLKYTLPAFNINDFTEQSELIRDALSAFCETLSVSQKNMFVDEILCAVWTPYGFYYFCMHVFREKKIILSVSTIKDMLKIGKGLPNKVIRNLCFRELDVLLFELSCPRTLHDYVEIIKLLNKGTGIWEKGPWKYFDYNVGYVSELIEFLRDGKKKNRCKYLRCDISYISEIKNEILLWTNSKELDLDHIHILMYLMKSINGFTNIQWLIDLIKNSTKSKLRLRLWDAVALHLCHIIKSSYENATIFYKDIQRRLTNLNSFEEVFIFAVKMLMSDSCYGRADLLQKCIEILTSVTHTQYSDLQKNVAFQILSASYGMDEQVITFYVPKLLDSQTNIDPHICIAFLEMYFMREINNSKYCEALAILQNVVQMQNDSVIVPVFQSLKHLLTSKYQMEEILVDFLDTCLEVMINLKKTGHFNLAVEEYAASIFNYRSLKHKVIREHGLVIAQRLLNSSKSNDVTALCLSRALYLLDASDAVPFSEIIVEFLLYGSFLKKSQRFEHEIYRHNAEFTGENPFAQQSATRCFAIATVEKLLKGNTISVELFQSLLIAKYQTNFEKRYFDNSEVHLQKLRILQALLVSQHYEPVGSETLLNFLVDCLCKESHQKSVKYLIQWLIIRIIKEENAQIIENRMATVSREQPSSITCFVTVLFHLTLRSVNEIFWIRVAEILLPWTMGAHFNLRLHAQTAFSVMFQTAKDKNLIDFTNKYQEFYNCVCQSLSSERSIDETDYNFLVKFNADRHYSLETIYREIPKHTNVVSTEWEYLEFKLFDSSSIKIRNSTSDGPPFNLTCKIKHTVEHTSSLSTNLQKKITPWNLGSVPIKIPSNTGELIVVASLIDKAPNLGGLSRTCHVFGVKQLMLNKASVLNDSEFKNLSMSSENEIHIVEVKRDNLRDIILKLKQKGYATICAEQTAESKKLNNFQFPAKTLLLLGNERDGVPSNLLPLMDSCIEIPQLGVVRSLNVHVAGATFIWEYAKQHLFH